MTFKILLTFTIFVYPFIASPTQPIKARSIGENAYYVSPSGNDANTGKSPEKAWKSIQKLNDAHVGPGDKIFFEGGFTYTGTITLSSDESGTPGNWISFSSYGNKSAFIDAGPGIGLMADSCNFISISNLNFKGSGRKTGNRGDGIIISNADSINLSSIELSGFQHSGLHIHNCRNVNISYVYAHDNGFAGIHVTGNSFWDKIKYDNKNIYIGHCIAENNPGDPSVTDNHSGNGILASSTNGGIIEYCEAFNNGWDMPWNGNGPVGIWLWDCTNFIIQDCISHDNKTSVGAADGGGFDFDGGVSNSILQYCLSYHNQGPGIGLFEFGAVKPWENNIVRYNISQDDGINGTASLEIWRGDNGGVIRNCEIYNNSFYNSNPDGASLCVMNNWPGFNFRNNIFVYNGSFLLKDKKLSTELFQGNCYWNLKGDSAFLGYKSLREWALKTSNEMMDGTFIGIYSDPMLENAGKSNIKDPVQLHSAYFKDYRLKPGSPLINKGLNLREKFGLDPGTKDLYYNKIPSGSNYDIGANELQNGIR